VFRLGSSDFCDPFVFEDPSPFDIFFWDSSYFFRRLIFLVYAFSSRFFAFSSFFYTNSFVSDGGRSS
jgi:hypothetical protein